MWHLVDMSGSVLLHGFLLAPDPRQALYPAPDNLQRTVVQQDDPCLLHDLPGLLGHQELGIRLPHLSAAGFDGLQLGVTDVGVGCPLAQAHGQGAE